MNGKVLVVCASRGRPEQLERMLASLRQTSSQADVAVYLDHDDQGKYPDPLPHGAIRAYGQRIGQCRSLNALVARMTGYLAYGAATDDSQFLSPGWDQWVLSATEKFSGPGAMSPYHEGRPSMQPRMDFPWVTAGWIKALGWFAYPHTRSFYWDVIIEALALATGRMVYAPKESFSMGHDSLEHINDADVHPDAKEAICYLATDMRKAMQALGSGV